MGLFLVPPAADRLTKEALQAIKNARKHPKSPVFALLKLNFGAVGPEVRAPRAPAALAFERAAAAAPAQHEAPRSQQLKAKRANQRPKRRFRDLGNLYIQGLI